MRSDDRNRNVRRNCQANENKIHAHIGKWHVWVCVCLVENSVDDHHFSISKEKTGNCCGRSHLGLSRFFNYSSLFICFLHSYSVASKFVFIFRPPVIFILNWRNACFFFVFFLFVFEFNRVKYQNHPKTKKKCDTKIS